MYDKSSAEGHQVALRISVWNKGGPGFQGLVENFEIANEILVVDLYLQAPRRSRCLPGEVHVELQCRRHRVSAD